MARLVTDRSKLTVFLGRRKLDVVVWAGNGQDGSVSDLWKRADTKHGIIAEVLGSFLVHPQRKIVPRQHLALLFASCSQNLASAENL
jgi:hypothetical protein